MARLPARSAKLGLPARLAKLDLSDAPLRKLVASAANAANLPSASRVHGLARNPPRGTTLAKVISVSRSQVLPRRGVGFSGIGGITRFQHDAFVGELRSRLTRREKRAAVLPAKLDAADVVAADRFRARWRRGVGKGVSG